MAWKETNVMEERQSFITEFLKSKKPFNQLCAEYDISEKTGHKWKKRFIQYGISGLEDESRRPKSCPSQLSEDVTIRILNLREAHPYWGAKKLEELYKRAHGEAEAPSVSSINRVLEKAGKLKKRTVRRIGADPHRLRQKIQAKEPNDVWTVDFKGWWVSDHEKCLPLTIRDLASKNLFDIRLMQSTSSKAVRSVFTSLFYKYGLPKVIRSDNGTPFASHNGLLGLTDLSCWWLSLGIIPDRTDLGSPGQNGSHERMHADISREIQGNVKGGIRENQIALDLWRKEYNEIRPNEAIGMKTPSEVYVPSPRKYYGDPEIIEYPLGFYPRKVNKDGYVRYSSIQIYISGALRGLTIGLQPRSDSMCLVWLAEFPLGLLNTSTFAFSPDLDV